MNKVKVSLIGFSSIILYELKTPKTIDEIKCKYSLFINRTGEAFLFERALMLLVNLSKVAKVGDKLVAVNRKVNSRDLVKAVGL